jgi:hypothetical protein
MERLSNSRLLIDLKNIKKFHQKRILLFKPDCSPLSLLPVQSTYIHYRHFFNHNVYKFVCCKVTLGITDIKILLAFSCNTLLAISILSSISCIVYYWRINLITSIFRRSFPVNSFGIIYSMWEIIKSKIQNCICNLIWLLDRSFKVMHDSIFVN